LRGMRGAGGKITALDPLRVEMPLQTWGRSGGPVRAGKNASGQAGDRARTVLVCPGPEAERRALAGSTSGPNSTAFWAARIPCSRSSFERRNRSFAPRGLPPRSHWTSAGSPGLLCRSRSAKRGAQGGEHVRTSEGRIFPARRCRRPQDKCILRKPRVASKWRGTPERIAGRQKGAATIRFKPLEPLHLAAAQRGDRVHRLDIPAGRAEGGAELAGDPRIR